MNGLFHSLPKPRPHEQRAHPQQGSLPTPTVPHPHWARWIGEEKLVAQDPANMAGLRHTPDHRKSAP